MIIGLLGQLRSGKSLATDICLDYFEKGTAIRHPLANPIYTAAHKFYKENGLVWDCKDRELLQAMGKALNSKYPNGDKLIELHKQTLPDKKIIIIEDVRRIEQYNYVKSIGGIFIRIECEKSIRKKRCEESGEIFTKGHISDVELLNHDADYIIENNGSVEEFTDKVLEVLHGKG